MGKDILGYLNPVRRLGIRRYSFYFPLLVTSLAALGITFYVGEILGDPSAVGLPAIFVFLFLVLYFSFHDGIRGGVTATLITILYYLYLIFYFNYQPERVGDSLRATVLFGLLYLAISGVIGYLKERIDLMIERESNEKNRLRAILSQLPAGVVITDSTGRVVEVNNLVRRILGTEVEIGRDVGRDPIIKVNRLGSSPTRSLLIHTLKTGRMVSEREYIVPRPDGSRVTVQVSTAPIKNSQGRTIAAAMILSDVTQKKELEQRKDDFVNIASHELKTPLTSLKLFFDSLSGHVNKYKDPKTEKTLSSIRTQLDRMQELVFGLLDISRLQTGKFTFDKSSFRLDELVRHTAADLAAVSRRDIRVAKSPGIRIYADKYRLGQVITNLLTNAVKYSPPDSPIDIRLWRQNGFAGFSVTDFGPGIDPSQHARIFDRLYQVSDARGRTFPGMGMGLYISREIIKRHNGRIWVDSRPGQGATFSVSLPSEVKR